MKRAPHTVAFFIAEHDMDDPLRSRGAIIFEQYTNHDKERVFEKAQQMASSGKYGRIWYGEISALDLEEVKPSPKSIQIIDAPRPE